MNPSWYDVLDVEPTASADEVRETWRSAVSGLDPTDRRFRLLNQAAEVLLDPARRAAYDTERAEQESHLEAQEPAEVEGDSGDDGGDSTEPALTPTASSTGPVAEVGARVGAERGRWVVPGWLLIAVAFLLAVSLGVIGVSLTKPSDSALSDDASAARVAAERAIVPILSYNAKHLDQSSSQAEQFMTNDEKDQYAKLFAVIRQNAPRTGTVVQATYLTSGIIRTGDGRVDVLVFVDQSTRNKHQAQPVVYKNQVSVSMEKVGSDWLVDSLRTSTDRQ